jgi:hypothetical protein
MRRQNARWLLVLAVAIVLGSASWFVLRPIQKPETLRQAASRFLGCLLRGNGECVAEYLSPEEERMSGMDKQKLAEMVHKYVSPSLSGFELEGEPNLDEYERGSGLAQIVSVTHRDGRASGAVFLTHHTEDGPKVYPIVAPCVLLVSGTLRRRDEGLGQAASWRAIAAGTLQAKDKLSALGISGMVVNEEPDRYYDWDSWFRRSTDRAIQLAVAERERK